MKSAVIVMALVAQFDRELDAAKPGQWNLEKSQAYQQLFAIHSGQDPSSVNASKFTPGSGDDGQLDGSEFPYNTWAITFDDGPHKTNTRKVLNALSAVDIKATFFWVAENVVRYNRVVLVTEAAGHSLQNHSYTHADLVKATSLALSYEVSAANHVLKDHYAVDPRFYRLPFGSGASNKRVRKKVAAEKLISILWNVDSLDWADKNPTTVARRVKKQMLNLKRGIVLFHDIKEHTAKAFTSMIKAVEPNHFRYVTIPQIVDQLNGK